MNIIKYRNLFFAFSLLIIVPGILALSVWRLRLGIDFTGGTLWQIQFPDQQNINLAQVRSIFNNEGIDLSSVASTSNNSIFVRTRETNEEKFNKVKQTLAQNFGKTEDISRQTVGPTVSKELTRKAFRAVAIATLAIVLYITWAFRKVPKPTSSIAFGVTTVIALVHDILVVVGIFAILGHFAKIEVDSLFITALLTVLGFSVHDTIVVFDRIRENLKKYQGDYAFEEIVNHSILQTFARSLNTSLTVVFVLLALLLFGGQSIKTFVLALLIGIISGTYSSIFNAAPLLVVWQKLRKQK